PVQMAAGLPPLAPLQSMGNGTASGATDFGSPFAVEVSEVVHDPELDEAVIAFANADFTACEQSLQAITGNGGARAQHAETWLVLFDLYRATGQHQRFESLAVDYAQQFGWSAPQWYSLPKLVADAVAEEKDRPRSAQSSTRSGGGTGDVGWVCPEALDIDAVARLRSQTLQMPLPWVFDWSSLRYVDAEAAMQLSMLFRLWAGQSLEMRWIAGDKLFEVLGEAAPTGVRDADPAFWLTRLDALRLANRADQFDETAIDYCVTYEVSPPSWEPARCQVRIGGSSYSTRTPPMSMVSEVSTSFLESSLADEPSGQIEQSNIELSGQLVGDIGATLGQLNGELGQSPIVSVSCAKLIRVDFIAAGDLLNWVLSRRSEGRSVQFVDAHRLVALFFGAMGINEHAKVQVRKV
ncbi:MAG: STAS domain-containing protein, partial [Rubrivivax sp.]